MMKYDGKIQIKEQRRIEINKKVLSFYNKYWIECCCVGQLFFLFADVLAGGFAFWLRHNKYKQIDCLIRIQIFLLDSIFDTDEFRCYTEMSINLFYFIFFFSFRKGNIQQYDYGIIYELVYIRHHSTLHISMKITYIYIQFMTAITNSYNINNCWITFRHLMAIHTSIVYIFDVDGLCMHVIIQVFTSLTFSRRFDPIKFLY